MITMYFEYEEGQREIIVKSRLKNHIQFWKDIQAYDYILNVIQNGYRIPFFTTPPSTVLSNNKSSLRHSAFVLEAIHDLLIKGLMEECSHRPTVVNPLTVSVQNSGKKRLILDLRHVNKHLWKASVKFEDIRTAMLFISERSYCFKFDLHSAYHHIDIYEPHTEFLGFSWCIDGKERFFKFNVLPFGLSSACYIFTKVTHPLIKKWRSEGKQVLMYLDDGLGSHSDKQQCYKISCEVKQDLISSGFVPKVEKSMWLPCQQVVYLGYFIDIENGIVKIPQERLEKAKNVISEIEISVHNLGEVHVRTVTTFVGQIISMA